MLLELHQSLVRFNGNEDDIAVIKETISQLSDLFMVTVVGEFNAGKSTFVNALLGERYVQEGILPTTAQVCILKYGPQQKKGPHIDFDGEELQDAIDVHLPVPWLEKISLVDTPGTNAVVLQHEKITQRIIPRADIILFVTSSDRPFTESERVFLEKISSWHKKVVIVVNKIDLLNSEKDKNSIISYVKSNAAGLFGGLSAPEVFGLSAKIALESKIAAGKKHASLGPAASFWLSSGFPELEEYMQELLTNEQKVQSKLLSPLGVAEEIVERSIALANTRNETLKSDLSTIKLIDEQMDAFMFDLERDVKLENLQIKELFKDVVNKADLFFDEKVAIMNYSHIWGDNKEFVDEFDEKVMKDLASRLDEVVKDISDLISARSKIQSRAVLEYVGARHLKMVSQIHESHFDRSRDDLLKVMSASVLSGVMAYDKEKIIHQVSEAVKSSLVQSAFLQVSALTAGGLLASQALSVTGGFATGGIATAGGLFLTGALVLPVKKYHLKTEFKAKMDELHVQMNESLTHHLARELKKVHDRIEDSVSPFTRFVQVESDKVTRAHDTLHTTKKQIRKIKGMIMDGVYRH
mmetsp:Transcript_37303/g.64722  ORF Transcript_37303/g.64722 Transcript_37303/m.64722 type:complete len:581 (-) Transcript_37303:443-2185(-)